MIDELIPEAQRSYSDLEKLLECPLMYNSMVLRSLKTPEQINKWTESTARDGYEDYTEDNPDSSDFDEYVNTPLKYGGIKNAWRVDIALMIKEFRQWLEKRLLITNAKFDFNKLEVGSDNIVYDQKVYSHVIFCEGYQAIYNPFFSKLPFQPAKGEALELKIEAIDTAKFLRDDIFLVPQTNGHFWSGGSYIWKFENHLPTEAWKEEWIGKLNQMLKTDYEVVSHKAGIRPSVKGRKPMIGFHKDHPRVYMFNGLGTKGTSLGPFWARHLILDHFINGSDIDERIDLNRFEY